MFTPQFHTLRSNLVLRASKYPRQVVHYSEAASWVDLPPYGQDFAALLGDIAQFEYERGRPFLSAIVMYSPGSRGQKLNSDDPLHGVGLVNRAVAMGLDKEPGFDPLTFGHEQETKTYLFWQNPKNFKMYKDDAPGLK